MGQCECFSRPMRTRVHISCKYQFNSLSQSSASLTLQNIPWFDCWRPPRDTQIGSYVLISYLRSAAAPICHHVCFTNCPSGYSVPGSGHPQTSSYQWPESAASWLFIYSWRNSLLNDSWRHQNNLRSGFPTANAQLTCGMHPTQKLTRDTRSNLWCQSQGQGQASSKPSPSKRAWASGGEEARWRCSVWYGYLSP